MRQASLHRIELDVPPDAFVLARGLVERPGLAVLASTAPSPLYGAYSFILADPTGEVRELDPLCGARAAGAGPWGFVPWFVGLLPYEAERARLERPSWTRPDTRPAPRLSQRQWRCYDGVIVIDHRLGEVFALAETAGRARDLAAAARRAVEAPTFDALTVRARDDEPPAAHVARVRALLELIKDGELYQANLARRLAIDLENAEPRALLAFFDRLAHAAPTPFAALLRGDDAWAVSTSPELFLDALPSGSGESFDWLTTEPIKGTRQRAADPAADAALRAALESDPKERAELAMIVDVERNDLARVSIPGTVVVDGPPWIEAHHTVFHRVARVRGHARPELDRRAVLASMLPSGSVTGAPKVRAMEVIAALEPMRRGLYTGAIGTFNRDGSMRLSMAIRTAVMGDDGKGEYLVGGGIVADSDPELELAETVWKSKQLARVAGTL
ncbi:MAG: anthranilate synthase component I family protein [Polyangiaceae bacterium]